MRQPTVEAEGYNVAFSGRAKECVIGLGLKGTKWIMTGVAKTYLADVLLDGLYSLILSWNLLKGGFLRLPCQDTPQNARRHESQVEYGIGDFVQPDRSLHTFGRAAAAFNKMPSRSGRWTSH